MNDELKPSTLESATEAMAAHATAMTASGEAGDLRSVLLRIIDNYGPWHDDDCPGDDTCDCSCKPLSDEINRVLKASEASGEAERRVELVKAASEVVDSCKGGMPADTFDNVAVKATRIVRLKAAVDALAQPTPAAKCRCGHSRQEHLLSDAINKGKCVAVDFKPDPQACDCGEYQPTPAPSQDAEQTPAHQTEVR